MFLKVDLYATTKYQHIVMKNYFKGNQEFFFLSIQSETKIQMLQWAWSPIILCLQEVNFKTVTDY